MPNKKTGIDRIFFVKNALIVFPAASFDLECNLTVAEPELSLVQCICIQLIVQFHPQGGNWNDLPYKSFLEQPRHCLCVDRQFWTRGPSVCCVVCAVHRQGRIRPFTTYLAAAKAVWPQPRVFCINCARHAKLGPDQDVATSYPQPPSRLLNPPGCRVGLV